MILYVNGDSHSAGAEAINEHCFANDDPQYYDLGRCPHPDNLLVSYGAIVAHSLNANLICDAESASSNIRIIRTTREFLSRNQPQLVIIGWATWEREEWYHNGTYYQVSAGGTDTVPKELESKYKNWVIQTNDRYSHNELYQHDLIYNFHLELKNQNIPHFFFNTFSYYGHIASNNLQQYNWGNSYLNPYDENYTYFYWLKNNNFKTVNPKSYHFGPEAHKKWAEFLLPYLTRLL